MWCQKMQKLIFLLPGPILSATPLASDLDAAIPALLGPPDLSNGWGAVVAEAGKRQLRLAEKEKYPHVTFFFNGGRDSPFDARRPAIGKLAKGGNL